MFITFPKGKCECCGQTKELVANNNPLVPSANICFDCINTKLDSNNIEHADFFCRTFNLTFKPDLWIQLAQEHAAENTTNLMFKDYSELILTDPDSQPNLYTSEATKDLWSKTNKEWGRARSFSEILRKLEPIKESYIDRARLKWGTQYTFEELLKLDSMYSKTLKANRIVNPMQKIAVQTLCKIQIQIDSAIEQQDANGVKNYSTTWSNFAKQAGLETMINETKTDDITTVAELYEYMEKKGFVFDFFDGAPRDEVDNAINDIQNANKRVILEATGLQSQLEEMIEQQKASNEQQYTEEITSKESIQDLINFNPENNQEEIETQEDDDVLMADFSEEED